MAVMKITHEHVLGNHLAVEYVDKVYSDCRKCRRLVEFKVYLFLMLLLTPCYYR
jgi:hypothetical protein